VQKAIEHLKAEVWVVDNASSDNSIVYLQPMFPLVKFIANFRNTGFAKANNQALFQCRGKYVLFLNPDTLLAEDSLIKCIAFMEKNEEAGALGIRMIDGSGTFLPESKRSFPSPLTSFYKLAGLNALFPASKIFSRYSLTYLDEYKNHEVDVLSGAFMLAKKNVLLELKGFDEDFFMYGEDIDLSYRIQKLGFKNYYFSESTIIHFKGESSRKGSLKYVKMFYQAMSIFVKKYYVGRSTQVLTFFIRKAIWIRAGVSAIIRVGLKTTLFLVDAINILRKEGKDESKKRHLIIIAGSEGEYDEVKTLLDNAGFDEGITGRAATNAKRENAVCTVADLPFFVQNNGVKEIIFCRGEISYSRIIEKLQHLPKKVPIRFHGKGTKSIVGSDSKHTTGVCITANNNLELSKPVSNNRSYCNN
jgi:GT2 family glycosyltransferase